LEINYCLCWNLVIPSAYTHLYYMICMFLFMYVYNSQFVLMVIIKYGKYLMKIDFSTTIIIWVAMLSVLCQFTLIFPIKIFKDISFMQENVTFSLLCQSCIVRASYDKLTILIITQYDAGTGMFLPKCYYHHFRL